MPWYNVRPIGGALIDVNELSDMGSSDYLCTGINQGKYMFDCKVPRLSGILTVTMVPLTGLQDAAVLYASIDTLFGDFDAWELASGDSSVWSGISLSLSDRGVRLQFESAPHCVMVIAVGGKFFARIFCCPSNEVDSYKELVVPFGGAGGGYDNVEMYVEDDTAYMSMQLGDGAQTIQLRGFNLNPADLVLNVSGDYTINSGAYGIEIVTSADFVVNGDCMVFDETWWLTIEEL